MLAFIFLQTFLKVFIIFMYFLFFSLVRNLYRNLKKNGVCIDPKRLCNDICRIFVTILKKLYTYNFYSYNKSDFLIGGILVFIFEIYIWSNVIYLLMDFTSNNIENYKILYLIAFETHLFLEILCPLYYKGSTLKESSIQTLYFLFLSNVSSMFYI